tara:strand:- start:5216 stop:5803 length:588 start_codon:yes stop_codon:yes gene_type:complete
MKTRFILKKDFTQISNLWIKSLNNDIFSILGKKVVLSYLNNFFINNSNSLGFVIKKNKKIIAFLLYGNNETIIKQVLDQNLIFIFLRSIKIFLSLNLNKIKIFLNVLFFYMISKFTNNLDEIRTELLYICVDKNKFRTGMGSKIVKDSFVIKKNFFKLNKIKVKTLEKTPENIKFYKKQNFKVKKKFMGRVFLTT